MYKMCGYIVDNNGQILNFSTKREDAVQFCTQHGVPHDKIVQVFKNVSMEFQPIVAPKEGVFVPGIDGWLRPE